MSVRENLEMGAYRLKDKDEVGERAKQAYKMFPVLEKRQNDAARTLSGGELAMLSIARALMSQPKLILFDEPSLGLSPKIINEVYRTIVELNDAGSSILIAEQNVRKVLAVADYAYVLSLGRRRFEGECKALVNDERLVRLYVGGQADAVDK